MPSSERRFLQERAGRPFPSALVDAAARELDRFAAFLEREGITVRRPEAIDHSLGFGTPDWTSPTGMYAAMPRDVLLVVGETVIEAPMAWRARHLEVNAYRSLLMDYFRRGARWISAPRPRLRDDLYTSLRGRMATPADVEPTFDAADFVRCGRDLFVQRSKVTNATGIEWVRRTLGKRYTVHEVAVHDSHAMHIDATLMPLAPGKVLVNPARIRALPSIFNSWEVIVAPPPARRRRRLHMSSPWLSMNVLMLDLERVMIDALEERLAQVLRRAGFITIPWTLDAVNAFGGSFHCVTLDVRRRGRLNSYF
jgi:glycine amidinotransferase